MITGNTKHMPTRMNREVGAVEAAAAFSKALELAEKNRDKKKAKEGLKSVQTNLSNMGRENAAVLPVPVWD